MIIINDGRPTAKTIRRDMTLGWNIFQKLLQPLVKQNDTYFKAHCYKCDRNYSVIVNRNKSIFHCRDCGFGGDVLDLVKHCYGCLEPEAVRIIKEEYL